MNKVISFIIMFLLMIFLCGSATEPLIAVDNTTTQEQAIQFLKDKNATDEMIECIPYIYDYCDKVGIDATLIVGISSIETGYGKSHLCTAYNNPGGMKASKGGWMKFKTLKAGYKAMIDKIAVMCGVKKSNSYYYNKCKYIRDLGNIYWAEHGVDAGYYNMLIKQMNVIKSYKVSKAKVTEQPKQETSKEVIMSKVKTKKKPTPQEYLMSFTKKKKNGMDLIYNAIK